MAPRSIRIFLPDGAPTGMRIAELGLSTIKAVAAPRTMLASLAARPESQRTGIYFLIGPDPQTPALKRVYVGEGDEVIVRLNAHSKDSKKDYFEQVILVVSKDDNLSKAHARWLEAELVKALKSAARCEVDNGTTPIGGLLSEADRAEMQEFREQIELLLGALGFPLFEVLPELAASSAKPAASAQLSPTFQLAGTGFEAMARLVAGVFTVLKGSRVRLKEAETLSESSRATRRELLSVEALKEEGGVLSVQVDTPFGSPSQAAQVVCGYSMNGRENWATSEGVTYAQWEATQLPTGVA